MKNKDHIIAKYLSGNLDLQESQLLNKAMSEDDALKKEIEDFKAILDTAGETDLETPHSKTNEDRWNRLEKSLNENSLKPKRSVLRSIYIKTTSVAAILIIGLALYIYSAKTEFRSSTDEIVELYLPDSSKIVMNSNSYISYNKVLWNFKRTLSMGGEVYFDVRKTGQPFSVEALYTTINVLGTTFNIRSDNEKVDVSCFSGLVEIYNQEIKGGSQLLSGGEGTSVNPGHQPREKYPVAKERILNWQHPSLVFEGVALLSIFKQLEQQFGIRIIVHDNIKNVYFTGKFQGDSPEEILDIITFSAGCSFEKTGEKTYTIY